MQIKVEKKIGNAVLEFIVDGEDELEVLSRAAGFTTIPTLCSLCKSEDVVLDSNKAEEYVFVKVRCLKCDARSQMGSLKKGGIFWKPFEKYIPKEDKE